MRPELSAVIGAERFLAEIKLTANLQRPHILPLFDSGEADVPIGPVPAFELSPDDRRFIFLRETTPTERNEFIVVQNWVDEMKRRTR